jgi:hypothetical protein
MSTVDFAELSLKYFVKYRRLSNIIFLRIHKKKKFFLKQLL